MDIRLDGRVAIVTGASMGIGQGIAEALAEAGAAVVLTARNEGPLLAAIDRIRAAHPGVGLAHVVADVGRPEDAERCVAAAMDRFGSLDILVNSASQPVPGRLMALDRELMTTAAVSSLVATVIWTQAAWRAWMAEHGGAILNMASIARDSVELGYGYYGATKAAVARITEQMAAELGPGVRANALAPGWILTPRLQPLVDRHEEEMLDAIPLRRLGVPADIGSAAVFLLSDAASYITGQVLTIDGGRVVTPGALTRILTGRG